MTEFSTVVAAIDDDNSAADAIRVADRLAHAKPGGRLFVAHAVPPVPPGVEALLFPYACFGDDYDEVRAELVKGTAKRLAKWVKEGCSQPPKDTLRLGHGPVVQTVLDIAASAGPDLVVIATGGHGGGQEHAVGAVATGLVRRLPVPTLLARPLRDEQPVFKRIIAAIDLTDDSAQLLQFALGIAKAHGGQVQPIFVAPSLTEIDHAGVFRGERGVGGKTKKEITAKWNQIEAQIQVPYPIQTELEKLMRRYISTAGDPGPKLVELANETEADLVIIGRARSDGGSGMRLGRVAECVMRGAHGHVLVMPYAEPEPSA